MGANSSEIGTKDCKSAERRTKMFEITGSSPLVWEQLLRLAEGGDLRAIKLYYDAAIAYKESK